MIVPKSKPKAEKEAAAAAAAAAATAAAAQSQPLYAGYGGGGGGGFKKGTGYGGGHGAQAGWDVDQWRAAQAKKESEVCEIAHSLSLEMKQARVPPSLATVLEQSCLLPFLVQYLQNDSVSDMEAHSLIYRNVLDICKHMAAHSNLLRLFELLPGEKKSLASYLADMRDQVKIAQKFEKFATTAGDQAAAAAAAAAPSASAAYLYGHQPKKAKTAAAAVTIVDTHPTSLLVHILETCDIVDVALATYRSNKDQMEDDEGKTGSRAAAAASSSSAAAAASSSSAAAASSAVVDYVAIQSPHRFGEVEKFASHHYLKTHGATSAALSRQWVKRLGVEYSDLSKSLPINTLSSVYLRYKEDAMVRQHKREHTHVQV